MKQNMFLTNSEFEEIVGEKVIEAIDILSRHVGEACASCNGQCCKNIGCGFYSSKLSRCPIFQYRPAKCRFYFCRDILESESLSLQEREVLDTCVRDVSEIIKSEFLGLIFSDPPIRLGQKRWLTSLELEEKAYSIIEALERGDLESHCAQEKLITLVEAYRNNPSQ